MKLTESLPEGVRIGKRFYRCDFDFRNVLRMLDILARDDLMQEAREYLAVKCLMKRPRKVREVLSAVREILFDSSPSAKEGKKVTDFKQDAGLIRAAFLQVYGIDLYRDRLHYIEFRELLNAIPEGNRYSEVIGIRVRPLPKATKWNAEERQWLLKAKADVAIHLSEEEAAKKYDSDVKKIFAGLMRWAEGSDDNG